MVLTVFSILLALFHFVGPMPTDARVRVPARVRVRVRVCARDLVSP